ncbi:MAG: hypothetical protein V1846_03805 [Candidatus Komeilibacteria bacterium]
MKRTIAVLAILSLLITVNTVAAKSSENKNTKSNGLPGLISALMAQNSTSTLTHKKEVLRPAGKATFIYSDSTVATTTVYALTKDRHVWSISSGSWTDMNRTLPTTTPALKQWQPSVFLDARGDVWRWSGSAWVNINHP